jgi:hypothetical protein
MPLHVTKWERRPNADRDAFGRAALAVCGNARAIEGVRDARFYWVNADTIGMVVNAEVGAYGQNSGVQATPEQAKGLFALSDLARNTLQEFWGEAGAGEATYRLSR